MNILESQLIDQRTPFEFKHIRDISSGSYGRVIESLHKPTGQVFAMKLLEISEDSPEELIRSEIKFLIEMNQLSQKPSLFPSFYGYFLSLDENSGKNTFCLIFDLKERTLNDLIAEEREKVLYNCFEKTFFNLIHGLAYLQTMGICHRDLKPQNILIDKGNPPGLTLIDFGISKRVASLEELTQEMTIIGTENYFSPELREANSISGKIDLNPYKSDVFSLGLVLIKLGSGKLPRKEKGLKDELNKLILMIEEKYRDEINGEEEKQRKMCKIIGILKEMLEINAKLRPDFIELFYRSLRIEDSLDNIQKMILLKDSGFVLNEIPSIQKGNFLNNINENPLIKEKEEEKNQIEEEIPKDSLFERVKEYLMRENPSEIAINLVISGEINERLAFINKILILTDCLKEDLFDHIENYTELNPFIIEISRNKGNSAFESEFFINNSKKNTIKTDILTDFKHKLLEIHSYNSISYLKSQEKPFITQNISLKSLKSCFCIYSISHGFENPQFRGHLKEVLKGPSLFISLKPLIIQKYEPNYLKFIIKLTRKIACEYYTIFIKELAYCEKFKCDEKDNEKTLISKKNQKITEFEKLLKYEEDILVLLPMKKTVFFIEYNEKKVFSRLLIKIEEFLKFNLLDKTLFLMIEAGKNIEFNMKSKRRFPIEKLAELKDRTSFYLGEFEEQISVFFEKLHQGAIEDMRRNLGFFFELEGVISRGVELIRNTQDFFNKRNFVKEVFEVIIGYLQDFFRSKMIDLMFPFLTVIINETIDILGKEALEDVLQWKIGVNTIEEQSTGMEKLVLGLLLKRKQEMFSKIKGKLLISGKFLRLKEEAYNQVSKGIGFWSYEGAKLDIVKMALICLRENKLENIKETANVLTKVSMDFFKRLEEYPEERLVDKGKNEEVMLLKKEVLGVLGKDNSQKKEIWRLENLEELGDEGLKEVLQMRKNNNEDSLATHFFEYIDMDKDGYISRQDLRNSLSKLSINPTNRLIERIHKDLDFNNDGKINYHDFISFLINKHPKSFEYSDLQPRFHIEKVFDYWTKASIDLGESMVIPDEISKEKSGSSWIIFISGGIAGAISRTFTAPLDRLKIILQANLGGHKNVRMLKELKMIYKESGWRGYYLGNGTNVLKIAPETGVKFLAYDRFKRIFCQDINSPKTSERLLSGGFAGICSQLVIYPLEITKTRLALAPKGLYKGIMDCIIKINKHEGLLGLYKGLQASIIGVIPYASIDLAVYNTMRDSYIKKNTKDPGPIVLLMCGAVSSVCGQLISYPFALIRTRLQSQGMPGNKQNYNGMWDCIMKIKEFEGYKGFYRGIVPNFMKTVPAISISYMVFENVKRILTEEGNLYNKLFI